MSAPIHLSSDLSATELSRRLAEGSLSPVELVDACLSRIAAVNPAVNVVVTLAEEEARAAARAAEAAIRRGESRGPLHGLPVLIKDTQDTAGLRTTYGSPLFADHVPAVDAGSVARLRAAGAIILGKTNTPEWAATPATPSTARPAMLSIRSVRPRAPRAAPR